jgi:histone H3/H4
MSEATKAVTKFKSSRSSASSDDSGKRSMAEMAGLQNSPEQVALVAYRLTNDFPMTQTAAVYLAAVMECITGVCLELSGKAARDSREAAIGCRHLLLAVRGDEELDTLFKKCAFREGGVIPHVHTSLTSQTEGVPAYTPFEGAMFAKAKAAAAASGAPYGVFVDPRTGLHMGAYMRNEATPTDKTTEFFPLPLLDALSAESQQDRRRMAEAALSKTEREMLEKEGYVIRCTNQENPFEQGWGRQSLDRFRLQRLREVRWEQRSNSYSIPPDVFALMCMEVAQVFQDGITFTAEAVECLQTYVEDCVVCLAEDCQHNAIHGNRVQVQPNDLHLTRRIREGHWRF